MAREYILRIFFLDEDVLIVLIYYFFLYLKKRFLFKIMRVTLYIKQLVLKRLTRQLFLAGKF